MGKKKIIKSDPQILSISAPYRERERKYTPAVPTELAGDPAQAAAFKKARLEDILDHVRTCNTIFVTDDHPDFSPVLPRAVADKFEPPLERTAPRQRIYFVDKNLDVRDLDVEFRQETGKVYGVKQTVKLGHSGTEHEPTLDRREAQAKLAWPGINLQALAKKKDRNFLKTHFNEKSLKPAFRMISQRVRISYHPEGREDVKIELACDLILVGETVFGTVWQDPKLELEIKDGPEDPAACERILDTEEARFMTLFDLERQYESNAEMGYKALENDLKSRSGRKTLIKMAPHEPWWTRENRPKRGLY